MSDLRLRPRSVTEIVDAAFQLYKRDALEYLLVTAVAYAPWVVAQLIVMRGLNLLDPTRGLASATWILGALGIFAYEPRTEAECHAVVMAGEQGSGYTQRLATDASTINFEAMAREAVAKAERGLVEAATPMRLVDGCLR